MKLPRTLLTSEDVNQVKLLVGLNGSGKGEILNQIAQLHISQGRNVIGVPCSFYDQDIISSEEAIILDQKYKFHSLDHILNSLIYEKQSHLLDSQTEIEWRETMFETYSEILYQLGYSNWIGFKFLDVDINKANSMLNNEAPSLIVEMAANIKALIENLNDSSQILWINLSEAKVLLNEVWILFFRIASNWHMYASANLFSKIEIYVKKNYEVISFDHLGSGERSLLVSMFFIGRYINNKSTLIIDCPENSLHPYWQKKYIKLLFDIFWRNNPNIYIATHAPLIISGDPISEITDINVFKVTNREIVEIYLESHNIEEMVLDVFDVLLPENRYISNEIIVWLNQLVDKEIVLIDFIARIEDLKAKSYKNKQIEALNEVIELASQIKSDTDESDMLLTF